jgi:hypothetical protein
LSRQFAHETIVTIGAKRMSGTKTVTGNGFSGDDSDWHGH